MRFYGYNRHDYYFPRSAKEAFGCEYYPAPKVSKWRDALRYLMFAVIIIGLLAIQIKLGAYYETT
jgi:hypothetical protein